MQLTKWFVACVEIGAPFRRQYEASVAKLGYAMDCKSILRGFKSLPALQMILKDVRCSHD